jgi:hypothetical protein
MESATSYSDAVVKIDGYPDRSGLASAEEQISAWFEANC